MKQIIEMLKVIIKSSSPYIRKEIIRAVADLKKKAAQTENPFDDLIVLIIEAILNLPGEE